jgi:hypothetical protein
MKSIVEVLRQKEMDLQKIQAEIDALRVALRLVSEDGDNLARPPVPTGLPESRVTEINTGSNATRQFP